VCNNPFLKFFPAVLQGNAHVALLKPRIACLPNFIKSSQAIAIPGYVEEENYRPVADPGLANGGKAAPNFLF